AVRWPPAVRTATCSGRHRRPCRGSGRAPGGPSSERSGPVAQWRTNRDGRRAAPCGGWDASPCPCSSVSASLSGATASAAARLPVVLDVTPEGPRGGELSELVAHHRVGHEDRHVLAAVV